MNARLKSVVVLFLIAAAGGAIWGGLKLRKIAERNAKPEILNVRFFAMEDGPAVTKSYTGGDDLYLVFDVAHLSVDDRNQMNALVQFQAVDPAGHPIVAPVDLPVNGPGPKSSGETTPLRFHLTLPIYAVGGEHTIQISIDDRPKNRQTAMKVPFTVNGPKVEPTVGFSVQDHDFLGGGENDPLRNASYAPGNKIRSRFHVVGFRIGPEQSVKMRMDLGVVSEAGLKLLDKPDVVNIDQKFFYVPAYLPITASVDTPADMQAGRYRIQYVLHDDVAGTQISLEVPFVIAP